MIHSKLLAAAAGAAMLTAMSPAAHAGYAYGVSVDYWSYDGSTVGTNADFGNPITSTTPDAMFFYTGPVNWVYNGPQSGPNSVDTFLNINDVTSFSSPSGKFASEAAFGSSTLSVDWRRHVGLLLDFRRREFWDGVRHPRRRGGYVCRQLCEPGDLVARRDGRRDEYGPGCAGFP